MADFDPEVDYYEVLQVHPRAHQEVIKRAYRTILSMLQGHPDLGGDHETAVLVNQAYRVLSDDAARAEYDVARNRFLRDGAPPPPPPRPAPPRATDTAPPRRPGARPAPASHPAQTTLYCPRCGARNRLPASVDPRRATCGRCRASLGRTTPDADVVQRRDMTLSPELEALLEQQGEVHLHPTRPHRDTACHCLRCHHEWRPRDASRLPERCPRCRSTQWSAFRLFHCRHCGERFSSALLLELPWVRWTVWPWPYWQIPTCPACGRDGWHATCEQTRWRAVLNLFIPRG